MSESEVQADFIQITADIVSAFVSNNSVRAGELPALIEAIHASLRNVIDTKPEEPVVETKAPAVPIKKSITDDYIICLEDGKRFKSLKRHLSTAYNMTPDDYRAKWGLNRDYPMVAPAYASARSSLARQMGLGRKRDEQVSSSPAEASAEPEQPAMADDVPAAPRKRGRPKSIKKAA